MLRSDGKAGRIVRACLFAISACGGSGASESPPVVKIEAQQWSFSPNTITLSKGQTIDFELSSADVHHGFNLPDFGVRADIIPGQASRVRVTLDKAGTFSFHCDYYCGSGHEGMSGQIVVQ